MEDEAIRPPKPGPDDEIAPPRPAPNVPPAAPAPPSSAPPAHGKLVGFVCETCGARINLDVEDDPRTPRDEEEAVEHGLEQQILEHIGHGHKVERLYKVGA